MVLDGKKEDTQETQAKGAAAAGQAGKPDCAAVKVDKSASAVPVGSNGKEINIEFQ